MKKSIAFLLLAAALLTASCDSYQDSSAEDLQGTEWGLVSINGDVDLIGAPPSLVFEGEELSGNASCNSYWGSYQVEGDTLSPGPVARTEMYCQEPEGVMDQENRYLEILAAAESHVLSGSSLIISGGGNQLSFLPLSSSSDSVP